MILFWVLGALFFFQALPFPGPGARKQVASTPFLTSAPIANGTRNDNAGFVGMQITIGVAPITVTALGRMFFTGNANSHTIKIAKVSDQSTVVTATWTITDGVNHAFNYTSIANTTLNASTSYFVMSDEQISGDIWAQAAPVTGTAIATVDGQVYTDGGGLYTLVGATSNNAYVPPNFLYF